MPSLKDLRNRIASVKSTRCRALTVTVTEGTTAVEKPESSAWILYVPMRTLRNW